MTMTEREKQADALRNTLHSGDIARWKESPFKENWLRTRDAAEAMFAPKLREPFGPLIDAPLSGEEIKARKEWSGDHAGYVLGDLHRPVPEQYRPKKQSLVEKYGIADEDREALRKELGE